jgi:integrase
MNSASAAVENPSINDDLTRPAAGSQRKARKRAKGRDAGSVDQLESGRWHARVYMGVENGKRSYARATFDTYQQAQKFVREQMALKEKGVTFAASRITVGEWVDRCLSEGGYVAIHIRAQTAASYRKLMSNYLSTSRLRLVQLRNLKASDIDSWLADLSRRKVTEKQKRDATLSRRTVQYCRSILRRCMELAVVHQHLAHNPVKLTAVPRTPINLTVSDEAPIESREKAVNALSEREVKLLLDAAEARTKLLDNHEDGGTRDRLAPYWRMAIETGMRPSELLGLRWDCVELENENGGPWVKVLFSLVSARGGGQVGSPKTKKSARTIKISAKCVQLLREQKVRQAADEEEQKERLREYRKQRAAGEIPEDQPAPREYRNRGFVFATRNGTPIDLNNVRRAFKGEDEGKKKDTGDTKDKKGLLQMAGFPKERIRVLRLYDLRHTAISLLLKEGVPVNVVSERVGHASPKMTLDVYAHVLEGQQEEATARMDAILSRLG